MSNTWRFLRSCSKSNSPPYILICTGAHLTDLDPAKTCPIDEYQVATMQQKSCRIGQVNSNVFCEFDKKKMYRRIINDHIRK